MVGNFSEPCVEAAAAGRRRSQGRGRRATWSPSAAQDPRRARTAGTDTAWRKCCRSAAAGRGDARPRRLPGCSAPRVPDCRWSRRTGAQGRTPQRTRHARIDEAGVDAEARQRQLEQIGAAAVEATSRRRCGCRHPSGSRSRGARPRSGRDRADAALERCHALLEHRDRRVGDARVDVAGALD